MEKIRKIAKKFISSKSFIYRSAAFCVDCLSVISKEGLWCWLLLRRFSTGRNKSEFCEIQFRGLSHPFMFRASESDTRTIIDNFIREEYGELSSDRSGWMIDAGAYIGDTSAYFASKNPNLKIIALEPNPQSYEIASRNLSRYGPQVLLLQEGLWPRTQRVNLAGDSTSAVVSNDGISIECVNVKDIVSRYSIDRIEILKMDIEGAEYDIFSDPHVEWIDLVENMIIETHGRIAEDMVLSVTKLRGFEASKFRNLWYLSRITSG